jgi:hypothetical protein
MCFFDKNPVWKFPSSIDEDENGDPIYNFTECSAQA